MLNIFKKKPNSDMDIVTLIETYNNLKNSNSNYTEPNYALAEKVFQEFNTFNLKVSEAGILPWHVPASLLPYPKNYIKCAYYLYLETCIKKKQDRAIYLIKEVGSNLFVGYPTFETYNKNVSGKLPQSQKDALVSLFGKYEVTEDEYYNSPSAVDATEQKIIHDFGYLPEIEPDTDAYA